ncbi:MAG: class I SAM-dependent methyltransferase [Microcystaceae cyanobacterium]
MTATPIQTTPGLASRLVNGILAIKPLADFAKHQARHMMIERAEKMGVPWRENVRNLRCHDWDKELVKVENPQLTYPDYYLCSFHAYENGNLNWDAALEVESAAYAVHAKIWPDAGINGDSQLRQSYHQVLQAQLPIQPQDILDMGCSVGMSTFELQATYPQANITGLDLSPYYLAVAQYRAKERQKKTHWIHTAAESTGLPDASFDLVSSFLMFHELPQKAAKDIFCEVQRLLRPGGYFTLMDMNPNSDAFKKMPPYILTLLKSTEPYLDQYFTLNIEQALVEAGFQKPSMTQNSPRHRTIIAKVNERRI